MELAAIQFLALGAFLERNRSIHLGAKVTEWYSVYSVMPSESAPRIALAPDTAPSWMLDAVIAGGGEVVPPAQAEGLIWAAPRKPEALKEVLHNASQIKWVQLPFAGIENFMHLIDEERLWTCAKGVYAEPVAEMALSLMLAGMRGLNSYARRASWSGPIGKNLHNANVTIFGGGGIAESLVRMLTPFDCRITVVRNRVMDMVGVDEVLSSEHSTDALAGADVVVLALALTPETEGLIGRDELQSMKRDAWLINVGRGKHIVTDDLVWALENKIIGGAGLDVTDPEPLSDGHPLWTMENCIITPHVGNTPAMAVPLLGERITTNVRHWAQGLDLLGPVYIDLGY